MAPRLALSKGHFEGDVFVVVPEGTLLGKPFKFVDHYTGISPKGFTLTSEASYEGGPMTKLMTLVHTRK